MKFYLFHEHCLFVLYSISLENLFRSDSKKYSPIAAVFPLRPLIETGIFVCTFINILFYFYPFSSEWFMGMCFFNYRLCFPPQRSSDNASEPQIKHFVSIQHSALCCLPAYRVDLRRTVVVVATSMNLGPAWIRHFINEFSEVFQTFTLMKSRIF